MKNSVYYIIIIIIILIPRNLHASDFSKQYYDLREKEIIEFALELFEAGEYYRAITEAKRYISVFPQGNNVEDMYKLIGDAYLMSKELSDAVDAYDVFITKFPASLYLHQVIFNKAICRIKKKEYKQAEPLLQIIIDHTGAEKKNEAILWKILLLIQENRFEEVDRFLDDKLIRQQIGKKISAIEQTIDEKKGARYKSPELAGVMSAILPGSGQFYNERYKDGIYSFILNALFILGAYKAFDSNNYALGGILTIFEVGWYTGNIYSAVNGAHKYNLKIDEDIFRKSVGKFELLENEIRRTPTISVIFRFPF